MLWDRHLLNDWGLRAAIEVFGPVIPTVLNATYLCLYAIPTLCVGALYFYGRRDRIDRLLTTLLLGGCCASCSASSFSPPLPPRLAFPGSDLPSFGNSSRSINLWVLDHLDISTSVNPSGHVAVAFSLCFRSREGNYPRNRGCLTFCS